MVFLKVTECGGGKAIVNMEQVEMITPMPAEGAKLWFSVDGEDVMEVDESFEEIESMMEVALTGNVGVVSLVKSLQLVR